MDTKGPKKTLLEWINKFFVPNEIQVTSIWILQNKNLSVCCLPSFIQKANRFFNLPFLQQSAEEHKPNQKKSDCQHTHTQHHRYRTSHYPLDSFQSTEMHQIPLHNIWTCALIIWKWILFGSALNQISPLSPPFH